MPPRKKPATKLPAKKPATKSPAKNNRQFSSGIEGLDTILGGGLPGRHLYLLQGRPGTGKTTFALQFLLAGVAAGESVLYVSLSQSKDELAQIAASHGWTLDGIQVEELHTAAADDSGDDQTIFYASDVRLDRTREAVDKAIARVKPQRIVYDSILEIRQLSRDDQKFHEEILSFKRMVARQGIATLFIDLTPDVGGDSVVESLAHGLFHLEKFLPEYGQARRRIDIRKMRGVSFFDGYHDMAIQTGGVRVFPRIVPELAPEAGREDLIKSGVDALDDMLGGGMEPGTTTLVVGQSGTGKSTLASLYAYAALERGESVTLFLFEERVETFFRRSEGLGLHLRKYRDDGKLELWDFSPGAVSQGEFSQIAQQSADGNHAGVVVIDSFTGYVAGLPNPQEAIMQIQTLLKYLSRRGVLTILIVAQHGLLGHNMETAVDVSFLGDTVVFLRMYEWPAVVRRTITVVKKRHGPHDLDVRQFQIDTDGISIREFVQPPPGSPSPMPA